MVKSKQTIQQSFQAAFSGLKHVLATERNAQIHVVVAVAVLIFGRWVGLDRTEWAWVVVALVLVWVSELVNTAVERLSDLISSSYSLKIKQIKDISAAAVLIASLGAVAIGILILLRP